MSYLPKRLWNSRKSVDMAHIRETDSVQMKTVGKLCRGTSTPYEDMSFFVPTPSSAITGSPSSANPDVASCYTYTVVPQAPVCAGISCPVYPHCMQLKTTTLPPVDPQCPTTAVITVTPSCVPTCQTGCLTSWATVHGERGSMVTPSAYIE